LLGFTAHQKSLVPTYLENGGMIFRLALHLPTENTDDVTGQSFTIGGQLDERNCGQVA
jgi:hypothetical protein